MGGIVDLEKYRIRKRREMERDPGKILREINNRKLKDDMSASHLEERLYNLCMLQQQLAKDGPKLDEDTRIAAHIDPGMIKKDIDRSYEIYRRNRDRFSRDETSKGILGYIIANYVALANSCKDKEGAIDFRLRFFYLNAADAIVRVIEDTKENIKDSQKLKKSLEESLEKTKTGITIGNIAAVLYDAIKESKDDLEAIEKSVMPKDGNYKRPISYIRAYLLLKDNNSKSEAKSEKNSDNINELVSDIVGILDRRIEKEPEGTPYYDKLKNFKNYKKQLEKLQEELRA